MSEQPRPPQPPCSKHHPITFITIATPPPTPTIFNTTNNDSYTKDGGNKSSDDNTSLTKLFSLDDDSHGYLRDFDYNCSDPTADLLSFCPLPNHATINTKGLSAEMSSVFSFFTLPPQGLERTFDYSMNSMSGDGGSDTVISSLTLDDDLSIGSSIGGSPSNYLCHALYHDGFPKHTKCLSSSKNTKSCEFTTASSTTTTQQSEQASNPRIKCLKQKLRSIEHRFYHKQHTPTKQRSTTIHTSSHSNNLRRTCKHRAIYRMTPMIKSVLQIIRDCAMVNIIIYMVYLVIMFYKYSFLMAIQGVITTAVYSTALYTH